jgi:hypothetical protein
MRNKFATKVVFHIELNITTYTKMEFIEICCFDQIYQRSFETAVAVAKPKLHLVSSTCFGSSPLHSLSS